MTARHVVIALLAVLTTGASYPAVAQFNQFPQVAPPVPAPSPPSVAPGPAAPQSMPAPSQLRPPGPIPRAGGPPVEVPRGGVNDSAGDRASRCMHYGTAAGVSPGDIGAFTRSCINN